MLKLYVTKYCLTTGVYEAEGFKEEDSPYIHLKYSFGGKACLRLGVDVFETLEEAENDFQERKEKEIEALKKKIADLESLDFFYARKG